MSFSTRAQAMAFLIELLRSLQTEPCGCDLVQGCFCSPDGIVEDHSGMAPCYICGEWYAEQVYCRDEHTTELYQVDGRKWHEEAGTSIRHQLTEASVRSWLEQVVVVPTGYQYQQQHHHHHHYQHNPHQQQWAQRRSQEFQQLQPQPRFQQPQPQFQHPQPQFHQPKPQRPNAFRHLTDRPIPVPERSASAPASFMIPQEILDPSCRSPGFRIRSKEFKKDTLSVTTRSSTSSLRFCYTSERFKAAFQESVEKITVDNTPMITPTASPSLNIETGVQKIEEENVPEDAKFEILMDFKEVVLSDPEPTIIPTATATVATATIVTSSSPSKNAIDESTASIQADDIIAIDSVSFFDDDVVVVTLPYDRSNSVEMPSSLVMSSSSTMQKEGKEKGPWMGLRLSSEFRSRRSEERRSLDSPPATIKRMRFDSFPSSLKKKTSSLFSFSRDARATINTNSNNNNNSREHPLNDATVRGRNNFEPSATTCAATVTSISTPRQPKSSPRGGLVRKLLTKLSMPGTRHSSRGRGPVSLAVDVA
ncbi:hypothetical protein BGX28_002173 [Mortierella sp. GBA30]|nr:hypothetical protein BGX28_002173 [Mortierella sp. GBA30]